MDENLITLIRVAIGINMLAFGLSQLKDPVQWLVYIPRAVQKRLPHDFLLVFMRAHASVNVALGILYGIGAWPPVTAWLTFLWWLSILPFALRHNWKIGMRDFSITITTLAVALMLS